jgi:hypothetical protein
MLGAQGAYKEAKFATNAGGAAFGNPNLTRQGITAGATLQPAGQPAPPTDGAGSSVSPTSTVAARVGNGPPTLTGRPVTPGSLRARQIEETRQRLIDQARRTGPAQQTIATDGG